MSAKGLNLDSYLDIAARTLRVERRPLSARAILAAAYRAGRVPPNLYGKTQHKTLQARISEDIVVRRDWSEFFRTAPGRFFLREFLTDETIPAEFRRPVPTRRRFRELAHGPALAISKADLAATVQQGKVIDVKRILKLLKAWKFRYEDPRHRSPESVFVRSFVCVHRDSKYLSYRIGRYREDRDTFTSKRSIGFSALVHDSDCTLFNYKTFGIIDAGVTATKIDLDIPETFAATGDGSADSHLSHFVWVSQTSDGGDDLLAVIDFECPRWFEPVRRRLALNDLGWIESNVNNLDDFDPWSRIVLLHRLGRETITSRSFGTPPQDHRRSSSPLYQRSD